MLHASEVLKYEQVELLCTAEIIKYIYSLFETNIQTVLMMGMMFV
jgi:hypothetical protein